MVELRSGHGWSWCSVHKKVYTGSCPLCSAPVKDLSRDIRRLSDKGLTQRGIAKELGISQTQVWRVLKRFQAGPVSERFHAFSIKFNALVDYDHVPHGEVRMKQTVYKQFYSDDFICKIFHGSILISFRKERSIYDLKCAVANDHALQMVSDFVRTLPVEIKVLDDVRDVVARHNAFVNDLIAKKFYADNNRHMNVVVDDKTVWISDASRGSIEGEAVEKDSCVPLSTKVEDVYADWCKNPSDLPSVLTSKTDFIMSSLANFSENMNRHVSVMESIDRNQAKLNDALDRLVDTKKSSVRVQAPGHRERPSFSLGVTSPSVSRYRRERSRA